MSDAYLEELYAMLEDCEKRESKLSDWERGFIDSLSDQVSKSGQLTPRQAEKLGDIWERIT